MISNAIHSNKFAQYSWFFFIIAIFFGMSLSFKMIFEQKDEFEWKIDRMEEKNILYRESFRSNLFYGGQGKYLFQINFDCSKGCNSSEKIFANEIAYQSGPDEILFQIEGKTLQSFLPIYHGGRNYSSTFSIKHPGYYHLSLLRLRKNYAAVNEMDTNWPELRYETLVDDWVYLNSEPNIGNRSCIYPENEGVWLAKSASASIKDGFFDRHDASRVPFTLHSRNNLTIPVYVNITAKNSSRTISEYGWNADGCYATDSVSRSQAVRLLSNKTVVIVGDIQMRTFANLFFQSLCRLSSSSHFKRNVYTVPPRHPCQFVNISFIPNPNCQFISSMFPSLRNVSRSRRNVLQNRIIITNCGHSFTVSPNKLTFQKYEQLITNYTTAIDDISSSRNYQKKQILWVESPPPLLRQDSAVFENKDWKTLHRLHIFNQIANKIVKSKGYAVIPAFQPLLPLVNRLGNFLSFSASGSNDPILQKTYRVIQESFGKQPPKKHEKIEQLSVKDSKGLKLIKEFHSAVEKEGPPFIQEIRKRVKKTVS